MGSYPVIVKIALIGKDRLTCDKCGKPITSQRMWAYLNVETFHRDNGDDTSDIPYVLNVRCEQCHK